VKKINRFFLLLFLFIYFCQPIQKKKQIQKKKNTTKTNTKNKYKKKNTKKWKMY